MSRKAKISDEVKASWNSVKFFELTRGYAAPKALPTIPEGAVVILHHTSKAESHPFFWLAPMLFPLLFPPLDDGTEPPMIVLLDMSELCTDDDDMCSKLNAEGSNANFVTIGKPVARALEKLHLKGATLVAVDSACQLLLKLLLASDQRLGDGEAVKRAILIHPTIPTECVNALFTKRNSASNGKARTTFPVLDCLFETELLMNKRSPILRSVFKEGSDSINQVDINNQHDEVSDNMLFKLTKTQRLFGFIPQLLNSQDQSDSDDQPLLVNQSSEKNTIVDESHELVKRCFDEEWFDEMGRSVFMSELTIEMSKYSKQYEQFIIDMTYDLKADFSEFVKKHNKAKNTSKSSTSLTDYAEDSNDGDEDEVEIGALVLRGCRCVLVRSLTQPKPKWPGLRIPCIRKNKKQDNEKQENHACSGGGGGGDDGFKDETEDDEDDFATAIRAVSKLCEVDGINELIPLRSIPPIAIYLPINDNDTKQPAQEAVKTKKVLVYFLYAKMPPPPGPLEEADIEDEEDLYDWYTFPRAVEALRNGSADVYVEGEEALGAYDASAGGIVRPCMIDGIWKERGEASILGLHTAAFCLHAAATANQLPMKWGGVFGQELIHSMAQQASQQQLQAQSNQSETNTSSVSSLSAASSSTRDDITYNAYLPSSSLRPLPVPYSEVSEGNEEEIAYYAKLKEQDPLKSLKDMSLSEAKLDANNPGTTATAAAPGTAPPPHKPIPVTLLSGFLGAGKTTLMKHILTNKQGLKVAVIVNDMADINVDASILKDHSSTLIHKEEKMIELTNGCICCTLREDLFEAISALSSAQANKSDENKVDYILIESTGIAEPLPVAETFTFEDPTSGLSLNNYAKLDTLVTVVDGSTFIHELTSIDELKSRGWETTKEDERTIAQLFVDQLEFANVLILNKIDLLSRSEIDKIKAFLHQFNKEAIIYESEHGQVNPDRILNTNLFSMMQAAEHPDWLKEARIGEHNPESLEYGISSFTFKSHKPFHPEKLHALIQRIISKRNVEVLSPGTGVSGETKDQTIGIQTEEGLHVIRAKGVMWLATELGYKMQGTASYAGNVFSVSPGNAWWASIDKNEWPPKLEEAIRPLWREPHGDRQNELVVIGQNMKHEIVRKEFEDCLLTDDEFESMLHDPSWYVNFSNPFYEEWEKTLQLAKLQAEHDHSHHHH